MCIKYVVHICMYLLFRVVWHLRIWVVSFGLDKNLNSVNGFCSLSWSDHWSGLVQWRLIAVFLDTMALVFLAEINFTANCQFLPNYVFNSQGQKRGVTSFQEFAEFSAKLVTLSSNYYHTSQQQDYLKAKHKVHTALIRGRIANDILLMRWGLE